MTLMRRRPRAVYRVYTEEEYLAGVDALGDWQAPSPGEATRGRRLHRLAGAAALSGAVGTVVGVVGFAVLRAHPVARRAMAAELAAPRPIATARTMISSSRPPRGLRAADRAVRRRSDVRRRRSAEIARVSDIAVSAETAAAPAPAIETRSVPIHTRFVSQAGAETPAASAARRAPVASQARRSVQGEFGFER